MINKCEYINVNLPSGSRKILIFDNSLSPEIDQIASLVQKQWPNAKMLFVVKKATQIRNITKRPFHLYKRQSPCSISEGLKLALQFRKMRPDIILMRKHDLAVKFLIMILMCSSAELYLWKIHPNGGLSLSKVNRISLLTKPYNKANFLSSFLCSSFPLLLLTMLLPLLWIKSSRSTKKKKFWVILTKNLQQDPLSDSPWLFAWLQVVMLQTFLFDNRKNIDKPLRILVIRNDGIGDAINTIPLVRHLRETYPEARITVLCDSGSFLWENCPYIDEILLYGTNNSLFNRGKKKLNYMFRPFTFLPQLLRRKFDLVIDPVGRTETHILSYLCRGARRIANTYYPYGLFGNELSTRHYETQLHETQRVLSMVKPVNQISENECRLEFWFKPEILLKADHVLTANHIDKTDITIGVHPGAMSYLRCWPTERMAVVACKLARKHGMKILFFEPPDNVKATSDFVAKLTDMGAESVIIKEVDLNVLTAIIARCTLFICNDSGPMHLAATTQTPTVAIFGPGEYWRWQPLHPTSRIVRKPIICSPCSQNNCKDPQCILQVDIPDVLSAAESVLAIAQLIT